MNITDLPISDLDPDPENIRDDYATDIAALAADIAEKGLQTPLHVYPGWTEGRWRIWAGHRRWAALCMNGAQTAACIVKDAPAGPLDKLDGMVSENLLRQQLNPIEEAKVYRRYLEAGLTQADIGKRCGVVQNKVSTYLKLLEELTPEEQDRVAAGDVSANRALKAVRARRVRRGAARADAGRQHAMSIWVPHFNSGHGLYTVANSHCQYEQHPVEDRIGGACGGCWEWAIRRDERAAADANLDDVVAAPAQHRPAGAPAVLSCSQCGVAYNPDIKRAQCVVDNRVENKRYVLPEHRWVHAKERTARPA